MTVTTEAPPSGRQTTGASTVTGMVLAATERYSGRAMRFPHAGDWSELDYAQLGRAVREIAAGLQDLGVEPGEKVALLGSTSAEWTLCDLGALCAGAVLVPVYHTNSAGEVSYVLEHSGAKVLICEDAAQLAKLESIRGQLPALEYVVAIRDATGDAVALDDLRRGAATGDLAGVGSAAAAVQSDDLATIVYTSGTTGPPKGCELTHANLMSVVHAYGEALGLGAGPPPVIFQFLPLAHVLARAAQFAALDVGGSLAYWRGDMKKVIDDLAATKPTHFPSVPRVFEKIQGRAAAAAAEKGGISEAIFKRAVPVSLKAQALAARGEKVPLALKARAALYDRLIFGKVRALFGGELVMGVTGAAPIADEVLEFFQAAGVPLMEGYGMTESTAAGALNTPEHFKLGSVGRSLPGMETRIAEDGEVLMRGPHIFRGYHRDEEATAATMTEDGWLKSGDLGEISPDGFLSITGRKKDLIITSSGKNITPTNVESALREARWVSQAVVYGDKRSYLVALLTLDPDELAALAEKTGAEPDAEKMAAHDGVREELQACVDEANQRFARIEQVKRFRILPRDLSQDGGELTPTLKVKRAAVYENYADEFDRLYDD